VVPQTYEEACVNESSLACNARESGVIPGVLRRPLRFPHLHTGQSCPTTPGTPFNTSYFNGIALGHGVVRPIIAMRGDVRHGMAQLATGQATGWLAFKTLWFSTPAYQGPFVIRAKRLDGPGEVAFQASTPNSPLVVPPGPTVNSQAGYRTIPGQTWVKSPGCYGWQIDGLTFSQVIVVDATLPARGSR
jgi:hypothetical protein